MLPAEDATTLSLLYHVNSEPWLNYDAYSDPQNEMSFKQFQNVSSQPLPEPNFDSAVRRAIRERRSCRSFAEEPMPLAQLADILANAYGISGLIENPGELKSYSRPAPSGGALYPLEVYVAAQSVDGLSNGIYHYNVPKHALEVIMSDTSVKDLGDRLLSQYFVSGANVILMFSAVFERTQKKYGPRGYRYILLEAGHAVQNVCLLATELHLSTLCIGGFHDSRLNSYLGLDGKTEGLVYLVAVGHRA